MRPRSVGALALALLLSAASASPARTTSRATVPTILVVRVLDSLSGAPLPNAEVAAIGRSALTDARGQVRILWPADGELTVRVRQLGFRVVQRTVHRGTSSAATEDTLTIAMQRAAFALPQMTAVARPRCRDEERDTRQAALSESAMELLRFGAEQYGSFRRRYPFALTVVRRSELASPYDRAPRHETSEEITSSEEWGDRYFPGRVLQRTGSQNWFVPLLFVSALADSAFWARHCFVARGVETHDGRRVIRLDFSPARGVNEADWEGAAWIDSAASVLARVEFRLTNLHEYGGPRHFEGYTVFTTPSPFIARPDSTVAWWTTTGSATYTPGRDSRQALVIQDVTYLKEEPPGTP
jgi:carboxypeptidase family protein